MCSVHSIVTTFRGADIKVEVVNFCAAMYTLIDQDVMMKSNYLIVDDFSCFSLSCSLSFTLFFLSATLIALPFLKFFY